MVSHPRTPQSSAIVCAFVLLFCFNTSFAQQTPRPKNARELAMMRAYYDKTVWSKEVMAQNYEVPIVNLWDKLISPMDKYEAMASAEFEGLTIGRNASTEKLDWDIELTQFQGDQELTKPEYLTLLEDYRKRGFKIIETEWHHSNFEPATDDQPARSVVSTSIYATHPPTKMRYVIKGDIHIVWQKERDPTSNAFQPKIVDARRMKIMSRKGDDVFVDKDTKSFQLDPTGRNHPSAIHPVILHDLDGDHLPEISIVGTNRVYWNKGDFKFEETTLVAYPTKHVNAAAFGDFNGDGVLDLMCAPKLGMPQLYIGSPGGKFNSPPRAQRLAKKLVTPVGFTAGDVDGDGDLDVYIGQNKPGYQSGDIPTPYYDAKDSYPSYLLVNDGTGTFRDVTTFSGLTGKNRRRNFSCSLVDLDDDNDLDLLLTNDFHGNDMLYNDGKGVFRDVSDTLTPKSYGHGMSHSFGDYDLDGKLDFFFVAMSSTTARRLDNLQLGRKDFPDHNRVRKHMGYGNRMYLRGQDGFMQAGFNASVARTGWSWGSTTLDFDRDGDPDIYVANGQTSGRTTRDYCTRYWCHDLYYQSETRPKEAIKDFFGKMAPLFSGESLSWNGFEHNALLMNVDGEKFVNVGFLMNCGSVLDSRATLSGDIDLDGKVDLVFEHRETRENKSHVHLLKNNWQDEHHWFGVHLPHSTYGAKVRVTLTNGKTLIQHHVTGHSVWAQHPNTLHFGLGKNKVESVEVLWPSGKTTTLTNPKVDAYIEVKEATSKP